MTIKNEDLDAVKDNAILITVEGVVTIIHIEDEEDSGMEMTRITVTETIGIEIPIVKVILTGVEDGIITVEVKGIVITEEGDDGIPISSIMTQGTHRNPNFKTQITTDHPRLGHQYRYPIPYGQYPYPSQQQQYPSQMPTPSQQAANICQLCYSQGHYDYQCQFAGDFMARTQKAFNQGRSYSHQDPNHGEWSQGESDNNEPNGQHVQVAEDHDAADPPLRTLNVFYQGTNVEMLEETYLKFKKNILPENEKDAAKLSRASS